MGTGWAVVYLYRVMGSIIALIRKSPFLLAYVQELTSKFQPIQSECQVLTDATEITIHWIRYW